jgi:hypothetical protein
MYLYKQILNKDNNVFTQMQDKVFPLLWCVDMAGCRKFVHEVTNRPTRNRNTLSQVKACTTKLSHVVPVVVL